MLSSVGVERAGESANAAHYEYLDRKLRESKSWWKICVWHMTMGEMQVSYKGDSVGWGAYEICRKHGAFIVTGMDGSIAADNTHTRRAIPACFFFFFNTTCFIHRQHHR